MCIDDNKVQNEKNKYVAMYKWFSFWCQDSSSHLASKNSILKYISLITTSFKHYV